MADGGPVAGPAVQAAAQACLGGGGGRTGADRAEPCGGGQRAGPVDGVEAGRTQAALALGGPHRPQTLGEIALQVEFAGDVRLGQAQFAGLPQEAAQRAPGVQDGHRRVGRAGLTAVPRPQPYRQRAAEQVLGEGGEPVGGTGDLAGGGDAHRAGFSFVKRYCWTSR